MQKESRGEAQKAKNAQIDAKAAVGSPCGPRAVGPRSWHSATFVAISFACWVSGGTLARWEPRTVPLIGLIHSTLRLIHSLTTVGRLCNVLLEKRELRPCCLRIRGSHRALVPPDAQHAKGIATKVANRPERGPAARGPWRAES